MTAFPHFLDYLETRSWRPEELEAAGHLRARSTLSAPLTFVSAVHGPIVAPEGMETDLASIPRLAFAYIAPDDRAIEYASVIHDYLYSVKGYFSNDRPCLDRKQCDGVLAEAMRASGARLGQVAVVYRMVRLFGGGHWQTD